MSPTAWSRSDGTYGDGTYGDGTYGDGTYGDGLTSHTLQVTTASLRREPGVQFTVTPAYLPPLILLVAFTFTANVVVILCVYVDKRLRKPTNLYVVSLAVADAIVGVLVMNGMLVYTVYGLWPLSGVLCTVWISTDFSCCTVSMVHLSLIAHDRHQALSKPHIYKSSSRARQILTRIAAAWVVGVLAWLPGIIISTMQQGYVAYDCFFMPHRHYVLAQSLIVYCLPIVLMGYYYAMCLYGLRIQYQKIRDADGVIHVAEAESDGPSQAISSISTVTRGRLETSHRGQEDMRAHNYNTLHSLDSTQSRTRIEAWPSSQDHVMSLDSHQVIKLKKKRRKHEHIRSIRTLGVIIVIFLFCWLPFCLFWPISAYCADCIPLKWYEYSYWAAYLNSSVNPILYFLCNKDFRLAFKTLTRIIRKVR